LARGFVDRSVAETLPALRFAHLSDRYDPEVATAKRVGEPHETAARLTHVLDEALGTDPRGDAHAVLVG
jgi:hypothetical protein